MFFYDNGAVFQVNVILVMKSTPLEGKAALEV
jgi:hypothetical protein